MSKKFKKYHIPPMEVGDWREFEFYTCDYKRMSVGYRTAAQELGIKISISTVKSGNWTSYGKITRIE